jgi:hypothetical protein
MKNAECNIMKVVFIAMILTLSGLTNSNRSLFAQQEAAPGVEQGFNRLEQLLLTQPNYRLNFSVRSEGAFTVDLNGTLHIRGGENLSLTATGTFGNERVSLQFTTDGRLMEGGSQQKTFSAEAPEHLKDALILGFTRMGILHNLSRLVQGEAPDFGETDIREIVELRDLTSGERRFITDNIEGFPFAFRIAVDDLVTGEARLWMNAHNFLPLRREQTVYFEGGSMNVYEMYTFWE